MEGKFPAMKCGIANVGNTCFINAALQCLSRVRRFAIYFEKGGFRHIEEWEERPAHLKNMCTEWEDLTNALRSPITGNIVPNRFYMLFKDAAKREGMDWLIEGQNDSHEFMMFFLDTLHKAVSTNVSDHEDLDFVKHIGETSSQTLRKGQADLQSKLEDMSKANWALHFAKEYHPALTSMFHGQFLTIIASKETDERSFAFDPFSSINIAVPDTRASGITIQDCLDSYFASELMTGDDKWHSPSVGKVDASRATRIWKLPDVLIISLKRFTMTGSKINTKVEFPFEGLDMKTYVVGPELESTDTIYDLTGVVLHSGMLFGGHYVSIVRNPGGHWVMCNDSIVRETKERPVLGNTADAYTLIYQKRSVIARDDALDRISE